MVPLIRQLLATPTAIAIVAATALPWSAPAHAHAQTVDIADLAVNANDVITEHCAEIHTSDIALVARGYQEVALADRSAGIAGLLVGITGVGVAVSGVLTLSLHDRRQVAVVMGPVTSVGFRF